MRQFLLHRSPRHFILKAILALGVLEGSALAATNESRLLEDFESNGVSNRWTFSSGAEFPGAKGSFRIEKEGAHSGQLGGRLSFDFSGGGNYVSALLHLQGADAELSTNWNALRLWVKRPAQSGITFRFTDSEGQTFQKPVDCVADRWTRATISFADWGGHWGGKNDGKLRGPPHILALNVDHDGETAGSLLFDDLELVRYENSTVHVAYPAYRFSPSEGWHLRSEGNAGASRQERQSLHLDFTAGARAIGLSLPDHVLPGSVDRIRIRARGNASGHPIRLVLHTHFMTFQKVIGEFSGDGDQEVVTDGPPGPGWEWHSGENDGKVHGPLRLGEIQFLANNRADNCQLELREIVVDGSCPPDKRCLLVAESQNDGDSLVFKVKVRALSDKPLPGELVWVFRDWDGREISNGSRSVTVPIKAMPMEVKVPISAADLEGKRFLEAQIELKLPGQETAPVKAAWVRLSEQAGDSTLTPDSPFGMGVYLNRYGGDKAGLAQMERAAQCARDAGVKWTREDFSWSRIERGRGKFDWSFYDELVACARRNGITVYGIAGYWSSWAKPYTEEGIQDYLNYLRAMVRHYQHDIRHWEIWNEPNIFFWQGPKEMYADLLTRSYKAIKEVDPDAQVLGLSTAGLDTKFIDRMLGLKTPFDILTIHPYRTRLDDTGFIGELRKVSEQVILADGKRRPVWLTEMGWATHTPHNTIRQDFAPTSLREQAQLIARSYLCAIVSGVEPRTFWYDFRNDGDDPVYFEHQMGIVYSDFRPKPAYAAYATLTQVLRGRILERQLASPDGVLAYRFAPRDKSQGGVVIAWSPKADARFDLQVKADKVTRISTIGERTELKAKENVVALELKAGAPVYILTGE